MWDQIWDMFKFLAPPTAGALLAFYRYSIKVRADIDRQSQKIEQIESELVSQSKRIDHAESTSSGISQQLNQITVLLARLEERIQYFTGDKR